MATRKCFLIGPIGSEGSPERKHADMFLQQIVRPALSNEPTKFTVTRADQDDHSEDISVMIFLRILQCDLVVADLTFLNPNVFYELAFAHVMHKRVVHCADKLTKLPFDIKMMRIITVDLETSQGIEVTKKNICSVTEAMFSEGYQVRNPIISVLEREFTKLNGDSNIPQDIEDILRRIRNKTGQKNAEIATDAKDILYMIQELKLMGLEPGVRPPKALKQERKVPSVRSRKVTKKP